MEMLEPVQRAGDQEALHLSPTEVVDQRVPVVMETLARILMFVERTAIEAHQPVRVVGEMRRHPIEDDADVSRMQRIDKAGKSLGRSVACRRRKQTKRLITPRAAERML